MMRVFLFPPGVLIKLSSNIVCVGGLSIDQCVFIFQNGHIPPPKKNLIGGREGPRKTLAMSYYMMMLKCILYI